MLRGKAGAQWYGVVRCCEQFRVLLRTLNLLLGAVGHDTCLSVELVVSAELGVHLTPVFEVDIFDGSGVAFGGVRISCCFDVCLDVFVVELSEAFVEVLIESYRSIYYVFGELGIAGKLEVVPLIVSAAHEVAEVPELLV